MNNDYLIQGNNCHAYIYNGGDPLEIVCNATIELIKEMELIGATTPESEQVREVRPRLLTVFANLTGAQTSTNESDNVSIFYLSQNIRTAHDILLVFTDNAGTQRTWRQTFYIERLMQNGNAGEAAQYDLNLRGSGDYVESELDEPPEIDAQNIKSESYTVSGGVIQDNEWIGLTSANIIEVCREGSEQLSLGLPYSFNGTTGEITPDAGTTIDGQRMFVIWKY